MTKHRAQIDQDLAGTDPFMAWFEGSHVVDLDGLPLPVFHGSPDVRGILAEGFKPKSRGMVFFASDSYDVADSYADDRRAVDYQNAEPQTIPLYLAIRNPLLVDAQCKHWRDTQHHVQIARDSGHDGLIIRNSIDWYNNPKVGGKPATVFAWFDAVQVIAALRGDLRSRVDGQILSSAHGALSLARFAGDATPQATREKMAG